MEGTVLRRKDRSRLLILDAAASLILEVGYDSMTIDMIANRAGLARKTAYNLFNSKEDIADQLIARIEAESEPLYRHRIDAGEDAQALIERIILDSAGWCLMNSNLAILALAPRQRPQLEPPPGRPSFQRIVRDTIQLGQHQGLFRSDESPEFLSMILLGIYAQAMISAIAGENISVDDIARVVRVVGQGIWAASPGRKGVN
jgi:TetR/AcrR family transcriptional regulator, regulator of autoinduction and epiphytic fitness